MTGKLSTHVLDTSLGKPAAGVRIDVYRSSSTAVARREHLLSTVTNADGRTDAPLLLGDALKQGVYELDFHAGDYFRSHGVALPTPAFVDVVTLRFGVADTAANYHVPLVCTPWSYSTYRGS
jgi:5-hydroxyisourate hydrolase